MALFQKGPNNANGYRILALITILLLIVGALLPTFTGKPELYNLSFFAAEIILFAFTAFTVLVGFNAVWNDDAWKQWAQFASLALNLLVPAIFIAQTYNV